VERVSHWLSSPMCTGGGGVIPVVQEGCRALRERRSAPGATAMAVSEASHPLVEKPLDPFVDKTSVETDLGSNVGDGHTLGQE